MMWRCWRSVSVSVCVVDVKGDVCLVYFMICLYLFLYGVLECLIFGFFDVVLGKFLIVCFDYD